MKTKTLSIRMDETTKLKLQILAKIENRSINSLVLDIFQKNLPKFKDRNNKKNFSIRVIFNIAKIISFFV